MLVYEHHSERIYTARALKAIADGEIPARVKPLLALLVRLSKNGSKAVFASAGWLAGALRRSVSTFYEHRAILVELGLISVEERRVSYDLSGPSRIRVRSVREVATDFWRGAAARVEKTRAAFAAERKRRREALKSASPENRRQTGANKNSSSVKSGFMAPVGRLPDLLGACWRSPEPDTAARKVLREGLGMTDEVLALIPDRW